MKLGIGIAELVAIKAVVMGSIVLFLGYFVSHIEIGTKVKVLLEGIKAKFSTSTEIKETI